MSRSAMMVMVFGVALFSFHCTPVDEEQDNNASNEDAGDFDASDDAGDGSDADDDDTDTGDDTGDGPTPSCEIVEPSDPFLTRYADYSNGDWVLNQTTLVAEAYDADGNAIDSDAIVWRRSGSDDLLGTGSPLELAVDEGNFEIFCQIEQDGQLGEDSIRAFVSPGVVLFSPQPQQEVDVNLSLTLSAQAYGQETGVVESEEDVTWLRHPEGDTNAIEEIGNGGTLEVSPEQLQEWGLGDFRIRYQPCGFVEGCEDVGVPVTLVDPA